MTYKLTKELEIQTHVFVLVTFHTQFEELFVVGVLFMNLHVISINQVKVLFYN